MHILLGTRHPLDYAATLTEHEKADVLRACLVAMLITHFTTILHPFQLQASLAIFSGHDSIAVVLWCAPAT